MRVLLLLFIITSTLANPQHVLNIVGGEDASYLEWPWMTYVFTDNRTHSPTGLLRVIGVKS